MKTSLRFFIGFTVLSMTAGLVASSQAQTQESPIVVNFAYAPEKIRQGDVWKIYVSVTDPEGKMHRVVSIVEHGGGDSAYKPDIVYLKKGMEKQFTGHFTLHTQVPTELRELDSFILDFNILDRAGNVRKTLRFPVAFGSSVPMKPLPPEMEKDLNRRIGNIDIDFTLGTEAR
jgi:hypothetical protein